MALVRALSLLISIASVLVAVVVVGFEPAMRYPVGILTFLAAGAGALLVAAAILSNRGGARKAWASIGLGVSCWGVGEILLVAQAYIVGEVVRPGLANIFHIAGYPLILVGVLTLPFYRPGRFERLRLLIDATAGAISLGVVMWVIYLNEIVSYGSNPLATFYSLFHAFGDVLLATALMILVMRRSEQLADLRVLALGAGVAIATLADVISALYVASGNLVLVPWVEGSRLLSFACFALTAWFLVSTTRSSQSEYRPMKSWQLVVPYIAVVALFGLRLVVSTNNLILNLATTAVAGLLAIRQIVAIRERRELLERHRDDLVASVSHELRTPLTGIQGFSHLLLESGESMTPEERKEMAQTINVQSIRLGRVVADLIDVARDRLHNVRLNRVDYLVSELVSEAVATAASGRKVDVDIGEDSVIFADPDRVRQVLVNLVGNAVGYGRSRVAVVARRDNESMVFCVHDDGDGVPLKHQAAVFERFERGDHTFDISIPGSGIGLSVARDLVTAHGGTIRYRASELLGGACFEFTIPARQSSDLELIAAAGR